VLSCTPVAVTACPNFEVKWAINPVEKSEYRTNRTEILIHKDVKPVLLRSMDTSQAIGHDKMLQKKLNQGLNN
jgi:hypothetical protein